MFTPGIGKRSAGSVSGKRQLLPMKTELESLIGIPPTITNMKPSMKQTIIMSVTAVCASAIPLLWAAKPSGRIDVKSLPADTSQALEVIRKKYDFPRARSRSRERRENLRSRGGGHQEKRRPDARHHQRPVSHRLLHQIHDRHPGRDCSSRRANCAGTRPSPKRSPS